MLFGMHLFEYTYCEEGQNNIHFCLLRAEAELETETSLDELSGKLYLSTFQILNNKIDEASSNLFKTGVTIYQH